jgi:hypothetical protein
MGHSGDSNSDIGGLVSLLNSLFHRQFMAQAPGFFEPLDVIFQRIMARFGGLRAPAHLQIFI